MQNGRRIFYFVFSALNLVDYDLLAYHIYSVWLLPDRMALLMNRRWKKSQRPLTSFSISLAIRLRSTCPNSGFSESLNYALLVYFRWSMYVS